MYEKRLSRRSLSSATLALMLSACAVMPSSGPSAKSISSFENGVVDQGQVKVIDVTGEVARAIAANTPQHSFANDLGDGRAVGSIVGRGDVLDIAIWEAPPATLFGSAVNDSRLTAIAAPDLAKGTALPEQMVDSDGQITVPFAGRIPAAGRTPQEIARTIVSRLNGKAHLPQAVVRLSRNAAANVTVVGDVEKSARVPLTSRGERVLDVLAAAGGVKQPVDKLLVQITRGSRMSALPLQAIIADSQQNIRLEPDDVMTVLFQPYSFTALGAVGRSDELKFEATGISLAQALGRVSGLQDSRANVRGVFIFRFEDPGVLDPAQRTNATLTPDGKVPVIYRIDLKDPSTLFVAQRFAVRDKDVLYVSNAPLADFQKFVNVVYSTLLPVASTATAL